MPDTERTRVPDDRSDERIFTPELISKVPTARLKASNTHQA